jgi:origin recognition complex subunit 2
MDDSPSSNGRSFSRKRSRPGEAEVSDEELDVLQNGHDMTPSKIRSARPSTNEQTRNGDASHDELEPDAPWEEQTRRVEEAAIPIKRGRGRPKGSKNANKKTDISTPTKSSQGRMLFATPIKTNGDLFQIGTPSIVRNADRSARRKSARALIERTIGDGISEDEEDEDLARHIYDLDEDDLAGGGPDELGGVIDNGGESAPTTPSKRGRGRPKGSKTKRRSPSPPRDLPPHELYFAQNRGAGSKTSNNTLSSLALLDHEEYFNLVREYKDPHADDMEFLQNLHSRSFNQWQFELTQGFNICIYGWGSKRSLLTNFATHIYNSQPQHDHHKIVVVNGYIQNTTVRDIFNTIANAISLNPPRLGSQPAEMLESLSALLFEDDRKHITLIINSIDANPLRRAASQNLLSRLASHPQIHLVASADHPNFPLLWDSSLRSTYNFLFHDCTTFSPYAVETDVVDEVHSLLGRSGRRVGGKEGVSFVLKSLPANAKNLFQVLVAEQLAGMDDSGMLEYHNDDDDDFDDENERRGGKSRRVEEGVEYRVLYQKAVEEFICGNEVAFRTLLKEYVIFLRM